MSATLTSSLRATTLASFGVLASCFIAATGHSAESYPSGPATPYSNESVLLVILILALLAFLFWLLLRWSHRLDQASYLGDVYQETVEDFEYKRLATGPTEKLQSGAYLAEVEQDSEWLGRNTRPEPPGGVHYTPWNPAIEELPPGGASPILPEVDPQAAVQYRKAFGEWQEKSRAEVTARYRRDLDNARARAKERAKSAADVDLSVLRGRGAEFVLEFTTIVVIIFAALILGVLHILGTEQIGTLLAAIAGYVLGRATTRAGTAGANVAERVGKQNKDEAGDTTKKT